MQSSKKEPKNWGKYLADNKQKTAKVINSVIQVRICFAKISLGKAIRKTKTGIECYEDFIKNLKPNIANYLDDDFAKAFIKTYNLNYALFESDKEAFKRKLMEDFIEPEITRILKQYIQENNCDISSAKSL